MASKVTEDDIKNYVELIDINDEGKESKTNLGKTGKQINHISKFIKIPVDHVVVFIPLILIVIINFFFIKYIYNRRTRLNLIKVKDKLEMSQVAGDIIINLIKKNPNAKIGLSSWKTPKRIYKYLIDKYQDGVISFANVTFFSLDEFCDVGFYSKQSYDYYIRNNFLDHIDTSEKNIHLIKPSRDNCQKEAEKYNELLNKNIIDLQLLSIGKDGHFGFNEPGTPFDSETRVIKFSNKTREEIKDRFDYNIDNTPEYGITQGIDNIMNAKKILLVAGGKKKLKVLRVFLEENQMKIYLFRL